VQSLDSPGWGRRLYLALALFFFALHAGLLLAASQTHAARLGSDLVQAALGVLATAAALHTAQRSSVFAKTFWRFQALGLLLWSIGQILFTVYDVVLPHGITEPWPSDIFFFLWMTPALLSLFLDPDAESQWHDHQKWLDFAQVGILVAALYVFTFEVPAHWQERGVTIQTLGLVVAFARNFFVVIAFVLRAVSTRRKEARQLYGAMALFLALFAIAECSYTYLQDYQQLRPGTLWDLLTSLAFVACVFLMMRSPVSASEPESNAVGQREFSPLRLRILPKIISLVFPLTILLMAAHFAEQQFAIAAVAVLASFSCSSVSIILGERQQSRFAHALEGRNALLKSVFEGTSDSIYVKDFEGRYLFVNDPVARFFGKSNDEIIGRTTEQLTDSASARELTKDDLKILETGTSITVESRLSDKNNARSFLITRSPYCDASGKVIGIIGISRDITEHRLMEDRLRQSQKMEAIGTLAGGVAHDFNNILMVISGYGSVLSDALAADPKLRGHVEQIQKAGERAASLTRQLLAFSRKQAIQPVPLNLNTVVIGIEKLLHRLIGENIAITTNLPPDPGMVMADAGQMEQVILNLAINARDAMPEGGRLTLEIKNSEIASLAAGPNNLKPGQYLELIVSDTGVGMDLNVQSRVFEPFFTTKPAGKGTGLGLSTVYGIVQQANGHVTFTSQPGRGTTFRVYLPRIDSKQPAGLLSDSRTAALDGSETVLLVEDDPAVCELVRAVLTSHGYTVLSARRPQEAKMLCETHAGRIALLLSDVVMPEMNGGELSRRLTENNPQMKVLFMSGYIDDALVRKGIKEKDVAFLQKPFSPLSLARKVREVLDGLRVA
jgi:PAS domain S-box-containing protein